MYERSQTYIQNHTDKPTYIHMHTYIHTYINMYVCYGMMCYDMILDVYTPRNLFGPDLEFGLHTVTVYRWPPI